MGILGGVKSIAGQLGFFEIVPQEGESLDAAADRAVREILSEIVQGQADVFPLQTVDFALREQYGARIFQSGIARTVELVEQIRGQTLPAPPPTQPVTPVDTTADPSGTGG